MKPVDVRSSTYIDFGKENNDKDFKLKASDNVTISKYKKNFCKILRCKLVRRIFCDYNGEEIVGTIYKKRIAKSKSKRV